MATIRKHYGKWQGLVRRVGNKVVSKTFVSKTQARKWCKQMEVKLDRGDFSDYSEASKLLLGATTSYAKDEYKAEMTESNYRLLL